jgi:hypothetical protein
MHECASDPGVLQDSERDGPADETEACNRILSCRKGIATAKELQVKVKSIATKQLLLQQSL